VCVYVCVVCMCGVSARARVCVCGVWGVSGVCVGFVCVGWVVCVCVCLEINKYLRVKHFGT